jgi:exopolysaccharide biosynthesis polyprenyl glycosylphosphotransferase
MENLQRNILSNSLKIIDQSILFFCLISSTLLATEGIKSLHISNFFSLCLKIDDVLLFIVIAVIWYGILSFFGVYYSRRLASWKNELIDIVIATSVATLLLFILDSVFDLRFITPLLLLFFWLQTNVLVISGRFILRFVLERLRAKGINLHYVVIIGTNQRAVEFARKIDSKLELGYRIIGFVDDNWAGTKEFLTYGYPLVANLADFPTFLRNNVVDEVMIDLPLNSFYQQATEIVALCVEQGIVVRFISDGYYLLRNLKLARSRLEQYEDNVVISVYTGAMGGWPILAKRFFDFVVSLLLLGLLSPIFLLIAVLIKATSPGPVFFIQERIGRNKRKFKIIKFRTMVPDAETIMDDLERFNEASGPVFKIKNDPRVTFIGRFLRKTSLDELPQLINVLKGDMSLVGPRPLPVRDFEGFNEDWHRRRFSIKPGITCLWQIYGRSSLSLPFEKWMNMDMEYIDHWSLGLDLKILAKTLPAVMQGRGAY